MRATGLKPNLFPMIFLLLISAPLLKISGQTTDSREKTQQPSRQENMDIQIPPPPFTEGIFPCSECHADMEVNLQRRELEDFHDDIIFKHDETNRWCFDCHDAHNRDMLHTASGELIDFTESYKLCGQCHGPKLRDWRAGIHGRRTGNWNGQKQYLLCAHCHDPHMPKFKKIKPEPPPERPAKIK